MRSLSSLELAILFFDIVQFIDEYSADKVGQTHGLISAALNALQTRAFSPILMFPIFFFHHPTTTTDIFLLLSILSVAHSFLSNPNPLLLMLMMSIPTVESEKRNYSGNFSFFNCDLSWLVPKQPKTCDPAQA